VTSGLSPIAYKLGSILEIWIVPARFPKMSNDSRLHDGPDPARAAVEEQVCTLISLLPSLPMSVQLATKDDNISRIFASIPVPSDPEFLWPVFNRRMDILFGEDVHDDKGCLHNVMRGPFGMGMVVDYIQQAVKAGHLLWEPVSPKLDRLIKEIRVLV
jgi:hypothetical protein